MRLHAQYTEQILSRIGAFAELARVSVPRTLAMMASTVGTALDPLCYEALCHCVGASG